MKENKQKIDRKRIGFYFDKSLLTRCDKARLLTSLPSRNEFVIAAIEFYIGHLEGDQNIRYLSTALSSLLDGKISVLGNQIGKVMYKLAVEIQTLMYLTGDICDADKAKIDAAVRLSMNDVKRINGILDFKTIVNRCKDGEVDWQGL